MGLIPQKELDKFIEIKTKKKQEKDAVNSS